VAALALLKRAALLGEPPLELIAGHRLP
jgi:hypothetical protein